MDLISEYIQKINLNNLKKNSVNNLPLINAVENLNSMNSYLLMNNIWNKEQSNKINEDFSTEYLNRFDIAEKDKQLIKEDHNEWVKEFLMKINEPFMEENSNKYLDTKILTDNLELYNYVYDQVYLMI